MSIGGAIKRWIRGAGGDGLTALPADVSCVSCAFYQNDAEGDGYCRRHSPLPSPKEEISRWPVTTADDWCGDYEARP